MVVRKVTEILDSPPALDLNSLTAEDVPAEEFGVPDVKASETKKSFNVGNLLNGNGRKEKTPPSTARKSTRKPTPRAKKGQFVEPLTELYTGIGTMLFPFDPVCAQAVIAAAPKCAESLDDLAYQNDAVRRALISLTTSSAVGVVVFAHMPIIMAVVVHHVPAAKAMLGTLAPQMPESEPENNG